MQSCWPGAVNENVKLPVFQIVWAFEIIETVIKNKKAIRKTILFCKKGFRFDLTALQKINGGFIFKKYCDNFLMPGTSGKRACLEPGCHLRVKIEAIY
jgi:hypothetical protein